MIFYLKIELRISLIRDDALIERYDVANFGGSKKKVAFAHYCVVTSARTEI